MPIALAPTGVAAEGVNAMGVEPPGVDPPGVAPPGVFMLGVMLGVAFAGVSSHLDFLLLAPGVGVSLMRSTPVLSVFGVSAQPPPCPGVSED